MITQEQMKQLMADQEDAAATRASRAMLALCKSVVLSRKTQDEALAEFDDMDRECVRQEKQQAIARKERSHALADDFFKMLTKDIIPTTPRSTDKAS